MNPEGQHSGDESKRAKSAARWQDVAVCWAVGVPTTLGILCTIAFLVCLLWSVVGGILEAVPFLDPPHAMIGALILSIPFVVFLAATK